MRIFIIAIITFMAFSATAQETNQVVEREAISKTNLSASPPAVDSFHSGEDVDLSLPVDNDLFIAGFTVDIDEKVAGDAHAAAFSIDVNAPISGNLYAVGSLIDIRSPVSGDLTSSGYKIDIAKDVQINGNTRLAGRRLTVDGTILGNSTLAADILEIGGIFAGDVSFNGREIKFSDGAKIEGILKYRGPEELAIPASVISADRISYEHWALPRSGEDKSGKFSKFSEDFRPTFWGVFASIVIALMLSVVVAAVFLSFMPDTMERLRSIGTKHMGRTILVGFLTLATLIGLIPVSASTIIGAPLIPFVLLLVALCWFFGYVLGIYILAMKVLGGFFSTNKTMFTRLVVLVIGLIIVPILNFVPFLGWLLNIIVVFTGLGAAADGLILKLDERISKGDRPDMTLENGLPDPA